MNKPKMNKPKLNFNKEELIEIRLSLLQIADKTVKNKKDPGVLDTIYKDILRVVDTMWT